MRSRVVIAVVVRSRCVRAAVAVALLLTGCGAVACGASHSSTTHTTSTASTPASTTVSSAPTRSSPPARQLERALLSNSGAAEASARAVSAGDGGPADRRAVWPDHTSGVRLPARDRGPPRLLRRAGPRQWVLRRGADPSGTGHLRLRGKRCFVVMVVSARRWPSLSSHAVGRPKADPPRSNECKPQGWHGSSCSEPALKVPPKLSQCRRRASRARTAALASRRIRAVRRGQNRAGQIGQLVCKSPIFVPQRRPARRTETLS